MIVVIADDFTGATEIGGIGLQYGLQVLIDLEVSNHYKTDLLVIATNTRSKAIAAARAEITRIMNQLQRLQPDFIYKKIDSVLRGNVMQELEAFTAAMDLKSALLIPANPSLNRTIKNGIYYVNEVPIAQTFFSPNGNDSSHIMDLIPASFRSTTRPLRVGSPMPTEGFYIGDVRNKKDLDYWAKKVPTGMAVGGGAEFFGAILNHKGFQNTASHPLTDLGKKHLFVCGSTYHDSNKVIKEAQQNGFYISNMPLEIYTNPDYSADDIKQWLNDIQEGFKQQDVVVLTIHHTQVKPLIHTAHLKEALGFLVAQVVKQLPIEELLVEGGATTHAIIKHLGIKKLQPIQELSRGVTRMKTDAYPTMRITTKPGSYDWSEQVWSKFKKTDIYY